MIARRSASVHAHEDLVTTWDRSVHLLQFNAIGGVARLFEHGSLHGCLGGLPNEVG
jgi:hypothetical protein